MPSEQEDTKRTTCPTCGSPVTVVSADEGTGHYEPERSASGPPEDWRWAVVEAYQYALYRIPEQVTCTDIYRSMSWKYGPKEFEELWSWCPSKAQKQRVSQMRAAIRNGQVPGLRLTGEGVGRAWVVAGRRRGR